MPALLLGGACLLSPLSAALADDTAADLKELRAAIQKELADLKKREQKLHQEFLRLDQKSQLLDEQLRKLRAAGAGAPVIATPTPTAAVTPSRPATTEVAQTNAPSPAPQPAPESNAPAAPPPTGAESAPISGPSAEEQQARQVVETAPTLSSVGGVLTPKGQIVIDPSIEYDYWAQNQLGVNGFQIIPGIFFGNVFATRFEQNITTAAVTLRGGVTDRLELNAKIPFVYNTGSTTSLIPVGPNAQILSVGANGAGIGDVQGGASYQFNSGENGWPIFVGNFLFKTVTGTSPFHWPDPVPSAACAWPPPSDDKLKCPRRRTGGAREPHASGAVSTGYLEPYIAEQARSDSAASYGTRWPEKPPTHERCGSY